MAAWPALPEAVRQSILMLVKAAPGERGGRSREVKVEA